MRPSGVGSQQHLEESGGRNKQGCCSIPAVDCRGNNCGGAAVTITSGPGHK